jgi:uncharacterized protein
MKWSIFIIRVFEKGEVLLFNTKNSSIVILSEKEYQEVNTLVDKGLKIPSNFQELINNDFLIEKATDEKKEFLKELDKCMKNNKHFTVHILPTTACNFNCPYCYQSGIERDFFLNDEILKKTIKYIKGYLKGKDITEATLVIHGGEPTVNWSSVVKLLPMMDKIFKERNIKYRTQIVSNGYNLTPEKADLLSKYNWQRFQVTVDGPPESHNKRRVLRNGGETFDRIIDNIRYVIDNKKIEKVSLRINYDKGNIDKIPEFLEYIARNFDRDRIILSLGFISKTVDDTDANKYVSEYGIKKSEMTKYYLPLFKKAVELGFKMSNLFMFTGMCTSKLDNALVISSNGDIFKCLSGVGRDEFIEGRVDSERYDLPNYLYPELYEQCLDKGCPYLPLCHTGCRFESYLKNGEMKQIDCNKEVLDSVNEELLKYLYLSKN